MNIKGQIEKFLESHLENTEHFLVEIEQKGTERFPKLFVYVDGDNGIDIDSCGKISRAITSFIDDHQIIVTEYGIDVSSPGIDRPLQKQRQFISNKGRTVRVWLKDNSKPVDGQLCEVSESSIEVEIKVGKEIQKVSFEFENIEKTKVLVTI